MRSRNLQLVLVLGTVLLFGTGNSLLAAMICQPNFVSSNSPSDFPTDAVVPEADWFPVAKGGPAPMLACMESPLPEVDHSSPSHEELALLGSPAEKGAPNAERADGLSSQDFSGPKGPRPPAPCGGGNACGAGMMPTNTSDEQRVALPTAPPGATHEQAAVQSAPFVLSIADPHAVGLFRPPRRR